MSTNNNILNELILPELNSIEYGQGINSLISNINDNFQRIVESDYLRGPKGDSIILLEYNVKTDQDNNGTLLKDDIFAAIIDGLDEDVYNGLTSEDVEGKISIIYESVDNEESRIITSLPFIFIDPRYKDLTDISRFEDIEDCSCIVQYSEGSFKAIKTFPTLYYDKNVGQFCWRINGTDTGLLARGPKGERGENGNIYIMKIDSQVSSNKYIVSPLIEIDDEEWSNKINNGDFAFVFNAQTSEYYIGLLKMENNNIYAIINDNPIYDRFVGVSFTEFLKKLYITNDDGTPKGLFVPISNNDGVVSAHMICATPIQNKHISDIALSDSNSVNNVNLNILPVNNIDNVTASNINVIRELEIDFKFLLNGEYIIDKTYNIEFNNIINSVDSLKESFSYSDKEAALLAAIEQLYGIGGENIDLSNNDKSDQKSPHYYINESKQIFLFKNNDNTFKLFSKFIDVYSADNIFVEYVNPNGGISFNNKHTQISIINNTYVKSELNTDNTYSLNLGYNNINIGSSQDTTLNVNGTTRTDYIYSTDLKTDHANIDELDINIINNPKIFTPTIDGILESNSDIVLKSNSKTLSLNPNNANINGNFEVDVDDLNINTKDINIDGSKITINPEVFINNSILVQYGNTYVRISDKKIDDLKNSESTWGDTMTDTKVLNKSIDSQGAASSTDNVWRYGASTSSSFNYNIVMSKTEMQKSGKNPEKNSVKFKTLVFPFTYQGRSYGNNTDCPIFKYEITDISIKYYCDSVLVNTKTISDKIFDKQMKYADKAKTYFADSSAGSSYTDYVLLNIPSYNSSKGQPIDKIQVSGSITFTGDEDTSWYKTVGDIKIGNIFTTSSNQTETWKRQGSKPSYSNTFATITNEYKYGSGIRTIFCSDGIIMGISKDSKSTFKWNDAGYLVLDNVKITNQK